jgi:hypothetical protein
MQVRCNLARTDLSQRSLCASIALHTLAASETERRRTELVQTEVDRCVTFFDLLRSEVKAPVMSLRKILDEANIFLNGQRLPTYG